MMPAGLISLPVDIAKELCKENNIQYRIIQCPDEHKPGANIPVIERVLNVHIDNGVYVLLTAFFSELKEN